MEKSSRTEWADKGVVFGQGGTNIYTFAVTPAKTALTFNHVARILVRKTDTVNFVRLRGAGGMRPRGIVRAGECIT